MIIQLCKQLSSAFDEYILYIDNFFTSIKLFKTLRTLGIDACDIAKSNSEYSFSLLAIRDVITKKNNWGLKTHTVIDEMLCMIWVDLNTMQLMTIAYNISDIKTSYFLSSKRRHDISENSVIFVSFSVYLSSIAAHSLINCISETDLSISYSIKRYNQHMNDSNENAQQRAVYFFNRRSFRYWWLLFIFFHDVACLNAYIIYKTCDLENEHLCRENFIRKIATSLIEKNVDCERKRSSHVADIFVNDSTSEHRWVRLEKRRYCDVCRNDKNTSFKRKRESLTEMNSNAQKRRKRGAQTSWDCAIWICQKKIVCRIIRCWNHMHMRANMKNENEINEKNIINMRRENIYANREKSAVLNDLNVDLNVQIEIIEHFKQHFFTSNKAFLYFENLF